MTDIEIAQKAKIKNINEIIEKLNIPKESYECYGKYKAKINSKYHGNKTGKLILVTAINPTPMGEGKTTMSIGIADALNRLGRRTILCLREPSLGPVFGVKGGAAGGGYSQVVPMEDINLHFTGDIHAIESANNLLAAMIDNHIFQGNELGIKEVTWRRCMDMNDRQLRKIQCGLGGTKNGVPREDSFDITVASEVMAIFCLARNLEDLSRRLGNIIIGYNKKGEPITARDLKADGAMTALLKDAFNPNLVQTLEGNPALIHGGPFANIAHGCNSVVATGMGLTLADYVVTEAGFGADLGAEKFLDIKCKAAGFGYPDTIVLVATTKALKYNGGVPKEHVKEPNLEALKKGMCNLQKHVENIQSYDIPVVICINKFDTDTEEEIKFIKNSFPNIPCEVSTSFSEGGAGAIDLASKVLYETKPLDYMGEVKLPYNYGDPIEKKVKTLSQKIYGAKNVEFSEKALKMIQKIEELGFAHLPICVAKTQYSLSDDPLLLGRPSDFTMHVNEVRLCAGAGFIVIVCGKIMTMPGLPKEPAANNIYVNKDNKIVGLF